MTPRRCDRCRCGKAATVFAVAPGRSDPRYSAWYCERCANRLRFRIIAERRIAPHTYCPHPDQCEGWRCQSRNGIDQEEKVTT